MLERENRTASRAIPTENIKAEEAVALATTIDTLPMAGRYVWLRVLAHVVSRVVRRGGVAKISKTQIGRDLGLSRAQVNRAVAALQKLPGISWEGGAGRTGTWRLRTAEELRATSQECGR